VDFLSALPVWLLAVGVFFLRIVDVSLGTLRTISVVQGRTWRSVVIGFVEVLIWVAVVSQVAVRVHDNPILLVAFAGGFAAGNACGILLERRLAMGTCVVRMIASRESAGIADRLRSMGFVITSFEGQGRDGPRTLLFTSCPRRDLAEVVSAAAELDPSLFYTVERFSQAVHAWPLPHPTGIWAVFKKK
jgi:uncharacterized protein YebE (UPF0316 family)